METTSRYEKERDDFVSRAKRLLPWLTPKRLTYLAYWADTDKINDFDEDVGAAIFAQTRMLRLPELRELGRLHRFKPEPPWIERRIRKRNGSGERVLYLPSVPLKQLHRFLLRGHLHRLFPDRAAYGFEPGRSRREHAEWHCDQYVVVRVDIRRFFPSVEIQRVEPILEECGFQSRFKNVLAHLVTYHQRLPQGAPTSPKLADLVARPLDEKVRHLAKDRRWQYSRYADDLALSCSREVSSKEIGGMIAAVEEIVESEGFELNHGKTRVMKHHNRQLVAGALVNNPFPTVPREKRRRVRAIIHNFKKNGLVYEAHRYKREIQDEYGQPEVTEGRHPGEVKRSDRNWPYEKQAPFVPDRYHHPLVAYSAEDWPWVYDFWHYLSGLVGEINALDPARGRQLRKKLDQLKLSHPEIPEVEVNAALDESQKRTQRFWARAEELVAEINREVRPYAATPKFFDWDPLTRDAKLRVARSEEEFGAFALDVYRQLFDSADDKRPLIRLSKKEGLLRDLRFAVELRHDHAHASDPTDERQKETEQVLREGYERLYGEGRPTDPKEWTELQVNLCKGLLEDLEELRDWIAANGLRGRSGDES